MRWLPLVALLVSPASSFDAGVRPKIKPLRVDKAPKLLGTPCARLIHEDAMHAALEGVRAEAPHAAAQRLSFLQIRKKVPAHLGISLMLALRSQGVDLEYAVYCHELKKKSGPSKWIGVHAADGDFWRLDLTGVAAGGGGMVLERRRDEKTLARAESKTLDGFVSCAPDLPHINGAAGKLLQAMRGDAYAPWRHTPQCETVLQNTFSIESGAKADTAAAARSAGAIADAAAYWAAKVGRTGRCYEYALYALERSGVISGRAKGQDWRGFYASIGLDYISAKEFGRFGVARPEELEKTFGLKKIPTPKDPGSIPKGAVVVYEPGTCGFHAVHGHIEIAQGDGTACSDHCQALYPYCFATFPGKISVFASVR